MTTRFTASTLFSLLVLATASAHADVRYVPLEFRNIEGMRPFVRTQLNDKTFVFMLHSNAAFYSMTTHANAAAAGIALQDGKVPYGISSIGKVSELGRTEAEVRILGVGPDKRENAPISVFEVPVDNMDGMLGTPWLRDRQALVDYDGARIGFPDTVEDARNEDRRLISQGWTAHRMAWHPEQKVYTVVGKVDGKAIRLVVSTVAYNDFDVGFMQANQFELGPQIGTDGGPTGGVVPIFLAKRTVSLTIDGQATAPMQPRVMDLSGYDRKANSGPDARDGHLGCDFMLANQAVIDFATATLLIRPYGKARG